MVNYQPYSSTTISVSAFRNIWHNPTMLLTVVFSLLFLFFATGCGSMQEAIVGTWQVSGKSQVVEFAQDGTMKVTDTENAKTFEGHYQFTDDTHLEMTLDPLVFGQNKTSVEVDIRTNQMVLTGIFDPASTRSSLMTFTKIN